MFPTNLIDSPLPPIHIVYQRIASDAFSHAVAGHHAAFAVGIAGGEEGHVLGVESPSQRALVWIEGEQLAALLALQQGFLGLYGGYCCGTLFRGHFNPTQSTCRHGRVQYRDPSRHTSCIPKTLPRIFGTSVQRANTGKKDA